MANILVVDDAVFMRKMLSDILSEAGHEVVGEGCNAQDAVSMYQELNPDLVTLDIIMPEVEGKDAIGAVREIVKMDEGAKILMVSAMGQQEIVVDCIQAGAKDFIVKPFQPSTVTGTVRRLLQA